MDIIDNMVLTRASKRNIHKVIEALEVRQLRAQNESKKLEIENARLKRQILELQQENTELYQNCNPITMKDVVSTILDLMIKNSDRFHGDMVRRTNDGPNGAGEYSIYTRNASDRIFYELISGVIHLHEHIIDLHEDRIDNFCPNKLINNENMKKLKRITELSNRSNFADAPVIEWSNTKDHLISISNSYQNCRCLGFHRPN